MKHILFSALIALVYTGAQAQTQRITFKAPKLYPEGIVYNRTNGLFYVSSVTTGQIGTVDRSGNYKRWYNDKDLVASFGMKVDPSGKLLWVCLADPDTSYSKITSPATFKKMARLIAIDLKTGKKSKDIDLSTLFNGSHFPNDLCFDQDGNIYVTDSFSPVIYKVNTNGKASLFAQNELFGSEDIGLNGIVCHPGGYLLVNNNGNGSILKVPLAKPTEVSIVKVAQHFPGADGMLLDGQKNLILIQNKSVDKIFQLSSTDNWVNAKVDLATKIVDRFAKPSTGTFRQDKVWILNSKLNELSDPTKPPSKEFSIQLAELKPLGN